MEQFLIRDDKSGDHLIIYQGGGMKYVDFSKNEFYIDSEMVSSSEFDFAIYPSDIKYYQDYEKETAPDNIEYYEEFDEKTGMGKGYIRYKNKYSSNLSEEKKDFILNRIKELCLKKSIKVKLFM